MKRKTIDPPSNNSNNNSSNKSLSAVTSSTSTSTSTSSSSPFKKQRTDSTNSLSSNSSLSASPLSTKSISDPVSLFSTSIAKKSHNITASQPISTCSPPSSPTLFSTTLPSSFNKPLPTIMSDTNTNTNNNNNNNNNSSLSATPSSTSIASGTSGQSAISGSSSTSSTGYLAPLGGSGGLAPSLSGITVANDTEADWARFRSDSLQSISPTEFSPSEETSKIYKAQLSPEADASNPNPSSTTTTTTTTTAEAEGNNNNNNNNNSNNSNKSNDDNDNDDDDVYDPNRSEWLTPRTADVTPATASMTTLPVVKSVTEPSLLTPASSTPSISSALTVSSTVSSINQKLEEKVKQLANPTSADPGSTSPQVYTETTDLAPEAANFTLSSGVHALRGRRAAMEDTYFMEVDVSSMIIDYQLSTIAGNERPSTPSSPKSDTTVIVDESGNPLSPKDKDKDKDKDRAENQAQKESIAEKEKERDAIRAQLPNRIAYFGVFDGHGGRRAAVWAAHKLHKYIFSHRSLLTDLRTAIREGTLATDRDWIAEARSGLSMMMDGSTATVTLVWGNKLVTSNLGDSRSVLCRGTEAVSLSLDHKPNRLSERIRVEAAGGTVERARHYGQAVGPFRVFPGGLAVSRAIGDLTMKVTDPAINALAIVSADPEILIETVTPEDKFMILASDGLWDVFSNQAAVDFVNKYFGKKELSIIAEKLANEALALGSMDNVTVVIGQFNHQTANTTTSTTTSTTTTTVRATATK